MDYSPTDGAKAYFFQGSWQKLKKKKVSNIRYDIVDCYFFVSNFTVIIEVIESMFFIARSTYIERKESI
ncbi:hypothetical protein VspSTUT11_28380 [Vibrio sp. STUT-A11]|nr:hypothetical protein VspSTUT11_28380 [Vibrio sp. STUT-A11]